MQLWLRTPLGQYLLKEETNIVKSIVENTTTDLWVYAGEQFASHLSNLTISSKILLSENKDKLNDNNWSKICSRLDRLAIDSESVETIYLPHCLEHSRNPHEVLREAYRVLKPEGYALISCFNPWSTWGITRYITRYLKANSWHSNFISAKKLYDWLSLLGFEVTRKVNYCYKLPINHSAILKSMNFLDSIGKYSNFSVGGSYIYVAYKRVIPLTPIRAPWKNVNVDADAVFETDLACEPNIGIE